MGTSARSLEMIEEPNDHGRELDALVEALGL